MLQVIQRVNSYFNKKWPLIAFQPILYFFILGACVRLAIIKDTPPNFDKFIAHGFYTIWLTLGITSPILSLFSWFLIEKQTGKRRFLGMWFRLASDFGVFTTLLTFHATTSLTTLNNYSSESKIFSRYMLGACIIFTLILIIRDIWTVILTERLAKKIVKSRHE